MKKIAIATISVLAIWLGGTYIISEQTEGALQTQINKTNLIYADKGISYKVRSYKKGFFESEAEIGIEVTDPLVKEVLDDSFKPLVMNYTIEHGPLFFKNGLGFGLSKMHKEFKLSEILKDETKREFLKSIKDDITIVNDMRVDFAQNANYSVVSSPIILKESGTELKLSPLSIEGQSSLENFSGDAKFSFASLELKNINEDIELKLKDVALDIKLEEFIEDAFMLGDIDFKVADMVFHDSSSNIQSIHTALDITVKTHRDSKSSISSMVHGDLDLKDTKLPTDFPDIQSVELDLNMKGIGVEGLIAFQKASEEMQKKQSELIKDWSGFTQKEVEAVYSKLAILQEEMIGKTLNSLNSMLIKDKTTISYGLSAKTKDTKKSSAKVEIVYAGDLDFSKSMKEIEIEAESKLLELLNAKLDVILNKRHIEALPDAEMLKQQISMGIMQGFVKDSKDSYIVDATLKDGELMVNDNNLTGLLMPLLMFSTGGGMVAPQ